MATQKPNFRRGAEAAEQAAKRSGGFARTEYFRIDDGETAVVRFLTDATDNDELPHVGAWLNVLQHQMIPTKDKPDGWENKWPDRMSAICRYDEAFQGIYEDCYICDFMVDGDKIRKPSARTWALACVREEVYEDGKLVGIRDKTREITIPAGKDKDGKEQPERTIEEKDVVVFNMGYKNFFSILQGFASVYGTILDRDYWIKRNGSGTDTTYQIVPRDPLVLDGGEVYDLRNPEVMARYETSLDLDEVVMEQASDEFYAKFFDPRVTPSDDGGVKQTGAPAEQQAKPSNEPDEGRIEELASRVKGYSPSSGENGEGEKPKEAAQSGGGGLKALD